MNRNHNFQTLLFWIIFGFLLTIILFQSLHRNFDRDEFEAIHSSWKILNGEKIYVDFFQHHHPLFYYFLIPVIAIVGENTFTIIAIRIIILFLLLLIFVTTYYLATKIFNKETGIVSLLLLSTTIIFIDKVIEIRPDVPQTLFGLLSVLFLLTYLESKSLNILILSSLCLVISFLFLQKTIFLIFLMLFLLLINLFKKRINSRDFSLYSLVFILCFMPYLFYLVYDNSLFPYFLFNWTLNTKFLYHFSPIPILKDSYRINNFLWFFYILGLLFFMKTPNQKQVGLVSFGLLISVYFAQSPHKQYFMLSIPLIAIIAANAITSICNNYKSMTFVVLLLSMALPLKLLVTGVLHPLSNNEQLKKIDYVLSITEANDFVYDGDIEFNIFRKDLDFFWFSLYPKGGLETYKTIADYKYNIYQLIDQKKPKVISTYLIENIKNDTIMNHYIKSKNYNDLFIRTNI